MSLMMPSFERVPTKHISGGPTLRCRRCGRTWTDSAPPRDCVRGACSNDAMALPYRVPDKLKPPARRLREHMK